MRRNNITQEQLEVRNRALMIDEFTKVAQQYRTIE